MSDLILIDDDLAEFSPAFAAAVVVTRPGILRSSGPATRARKGLCIDGDEFRVKVPGCAYTTPAFPIPGVGTLEIAALAPDQRATKTRSGTRLVLLVGSRFRARFRVDSPAVLPIGPVFDPTSQYPGEGRFVTTNTKFSGT